MILIFEGCDKSGKSTLISDLRKSRKDAIVFKLNDKPYNDSQAEQEKVLTIYRELFLQAARLSREGRLVIFDRAYPSEMVYSFKRGYNALSNPLWHHFDEVLAKTKLARIVYCSAPAKLLKQRFEDENEEFASIHEVDEILDRYNQFLKKTKLKKLRISSTNPRAENLKKVKALL